MSRCYDDILNLKRPQSKHPKMSLHNRAAQFSPFAALTGYDEAIKEKARLTERKKELTNEQKENISKKLNYIKEFNIKNSVSICYFKSDSKKSGGKYIEVTEIIKRIDEYNRKIILNNNLQIPFEDIISINIVSFPTNYTPEE